MAEQLFAEAHRLIPEFSRALPFRLPAIAVLSDRGLAAIAATAPNYAQLIRQCLSNVFLLSIKNERVAIVLLSALKLGIIRSNMGEQFS